MQASRRVVFSRRTALGGGLASLAGAAMLGPLTEGRAMAAPTATTGPLTDADLFGVYDDAGKTWTSAPGLDYSAADGLQPVETAAQHGDYDAAAQALLAYTRTRAAPTPPDWSYNGVYEPSLIPLFCDHIWTLGKGEIYHSTLTLGSASATHAADVTDRVASARTAGGIGFMLMARVKGPATATFASSHADQGAPALVVTAGGQSTTLSAADSTYIAAGAESGRVHGGGNRLLVHDSGTGPFSDQTCKAYLWFDLSGLTAAPDSVQLQLTGSGSADAMEVMLYEVKETFDETTRTWDNTVQNTFSWQGDPNGYDWKLPPGADKEYYYQLPRFYFAGPMADSYHETGDEAVAAALISQMLDFIHDADAYDPAYGAAKYPRNLDAAARFQNWTYAYGLLSVSPSLDAAANTAILKTLVRAGDFLSATTSTTPNWMITIKSTLLYLGGCFPELSGSAAWRDNAQEFLAQQLADALYPDGGYVEASSTYARGVAMSFVDDATFCQENGYAFTAGGDLGQLAWYLADQGYPNGFDPAYGDSSYTDQTRYFRRLADALNDDHLRYVASLGAQGTAPDHTSVVYPDARVVVQRTGWHDTDWYLRLNADRGAHSHPDEMAVQVYAHDRPLLPAMGCFTYSDDPKSEWLRHNTQSNNTVMIDGAVQDSTAAGAVALPLHGSWAQLAQGWTDASPAARHTRHALMIDGATPDGLWIIADTLTPHDTAPHTYEQNWHLLPEADPVLDGLRARTRFADGTNLAIIPLLGKGLDAALQDGYYSRRTYEVTPARYVSYSLRADGTVRLLTVLRPILPGAQRAAAGVASMSGTPGGARFTVPGNGTVRTALLGGGPQPGEYAIDGGFGYLDVRGHRLRAVLDGARRLQHKNRPLVSADQPLTATAFTIDQTAKTIAIETPTHNAPTVTIAAPWAHAVTVNGRTAAVRRRRGALEIRTGD